MVRTNGNAVVDKSDGSNSGSIMLTTQISIGLGQEPHDIASNLSSTSIMMPLFFINPTNFVFLHC
jgi:hypothetical protein